MNSIAWNSRIGLPVPQTSMLGAPAEPELYAAGIHIYNRWLAEYCAAAPDRRAGLAHLPLWDLDATLAELEFAADAGLRGINFPAPRPWLAPYNDRSWDSLAASDAKQYISIHQ